MYDKDRNAYRLSLALARFGQIALRTIDLRSAARPYLRGLAEETGESVFLTVAEGHSSVVLDFVESGHNLRLTLPVGMPWPLHAGASNSVLLAYLPQSEIAEYLERPLSRLTPKTIADPDQLMIELGKIRNRGFAYSVGELSPDVAAIAVPILAEDQLLGAVTVAGPAGRLRPVLVPRVVARLKAVANEIVQVLEGTVQGAEAAMS